MQIIIFCCRWPIRHGHAPPLPTRLPAQDNVPNSPNPPRATPPPRPPLLTSMGKWANGKLKVEHVAAPQGGGGGAAAALGECPVECVVLFRGWEGGRASSGWL